MAGSQWSKRIFLLAWVLSTCLFSFAPAHCADEPVINIIQVQDSINPGVEDFIRYAIEKSEHESAECLIILLDTPGGLETSMRGIAQAILNSEVPIVVYVYPDGARAASAGVFVTAAADIAAMAPGTNIGAAHPVTGSGGDIPSSMNEKVMNDMLAFARSIAAQRGRNADWLQDAVKKSISATAQEAYKENVIDLTSEDLPALIKRLDGWQVQRKGQAVTLHTKGAVQRTIPPGWQHSILRIISNPNLAYMLLMIGLAGLYFELSQPGAIFPGVVGGISLILALYALQTLPVNYAGILIILLGVVFFFAEIKIASHGMLSIGGVICLIFGSLMLFRYPEQPFQIALTVFLPTITTISLFFITVATLAFRAQTGKPLTGVDVLIGATGTVKKDVDPEGKVFVQGELWNAVADETIGAGELVEVTAVLNLKLKVKKIGGR